MNLLLTSFFAEVADKCDEFLPNHHGKRVAFIPTACDVEAHTAFMDDDRHAFKKLGMVIDELDLANIPLDDMCQIIQDSDVIFIGGGNTYYLLECLRATKLDTVVTQAVRQGKPYIATSAGGVITAPDIAYIECMEDVSKAPNLTSTQGLGLVDFYMVPHMGNEPFVVQSQQIIADFQHKLPLMPISNHQAIVVKHDTVRVI